MDGKEGGRDERDWKTGMEERLGRRDRWKGVIGHHRVLGQLFFDILVDTMTQTWPAATENRTPVFLARVGVPSIWPFVDEN